MRAPVGEGQIDRRQPARRKRAVDAYPGVAHLAWPEPIFPRVLVAPPSVATSACPSGAPAMRPARARRGNDSDGARPNRDTHAGPDSLSGAHRADGSANLRPVHIVPNPGLGGMERSGKSCWVCAWNSAAGRGKKDEPFCLLRPQPAAGKYAIPTPSQLQANSQTIGLRFSENLKTGILVCRV